MPTSCKPVDTFCIAAAPVRGATLRQLLLQADKKTPCQRVGMMYMPWHWPAWNAQRVTAKKGGTVLNMEKILKSSTELGALLARVQVP